MSRYHQFAIFMLAVCAFVRVQSGLPSDWAGILAVVVGMVGAYVFFYHVLKFIQEKMDENGLVWKWLKQ